MLGRPAPAMPFVTFETSLASRKHRLVAAWVCAAALLVSLLMLPVAQHAIPPIPGFVAVNQTSLVILYAITAALFITQFVQTRAVPLLILGIGSLFTGGICLIQLVATPNVIAPGLAVGQGGDTLTWLWTFWHVGPPLVAIPYALLAGSSNRRARPGAAGRTALLASVATTLALTFCGALAIHWVKLLPKSVDGDDYWRLTTSGIGPAIELLTVTALLVVCRATRLRTVLQLWLAVSLALLVMDNVVTDLGAARATVGWAGGRVLALLSAASLLVVYLAELDGLRRRAESVAKEREAARAQAQAATDGLALALEASGMGYWELDLQTGATKRTPRHDEIFGHHDSLPRWTLKDWLDHVVPEDRARAAAAFETVGDRPIAFECRIRRASDNATRYIGVSGRAYADAAGLPSKLTGCVMDMTERRENEMRLRQAERMESVGQLTGGVAHDFNNLLTVVIGSLEMIRRSPGNADRVERFAAGALGAAQRGAEVTGKLLAFSRRQVLRPEVVNVNQLLHDFLPLLQRALQEDSRLSLDLDPGLDAARIDPRQLEASLLNLVANARDAMPEGGRVTIHTCNTVVTGNEADRLELAPGRYLRVSVTDTGLGMDEETARAAFEPFFTTKEVGRGTGLGLSQVYGFARQAGGAAWIDSRPGAGTTIGLLLPRTNERVETRPAGSTVSLPMQRAERGEVVLVVEDDPAVLSLAVECLRELGYKTLTATAAAHALHRLRGPERVDVLFSDIVMPGGMNGVQLAIAARSIRDGLKVVLTSGFTAEALPDGHEMLAGTPLLSKPYAPEDLELTLQTILRPQR